tara:strand:- start:348 stop:626 length:279 start_codon:yes stop_codon:yes gene_type:complete
MENIKVDVSTGIGPEGESSLAKKNSKKDWRLKNRGHRPRTTFARLVEWIISHDYPDDVTENLIKYAKKYPSGSYETFKKNFSVYVGRAQKLS